MKPNLLLLLAFNLAFALQAQAPKGFHADYLTEWQVPATQLIQLAEAMPAEKYSWRPGPGVRSVGEVYVHIAAGNFLLLDIAGVKAPGDLYGSLRTDVSHTIAVATRTRELEQKITGKEQIVQLLKRSLAAVKDHFSKTSDAALNRQVDFFEAKSTVRGVYLRILAHSNEHMGQSVAYARMNGIVPPWSR
jgi:uncharacterized damage-inducible protein DinB